MSHGGPDWGTAGPLGTVYTIEDMAELAARLGSIVTFDRRGNVVCLDDFEAAIPKWSVSPWVGTEYAILDSTSVLSGSQAVRLHNPDTAFASIAISKGTSILGSKRLGYEFSFSRLSANLDLLLEIYYYTGARYLFAAAKFNNNNHKLYIYDKNVGYKEVATLGFLPDRSFLFSTIKLVIDFDTLKYVRVLFNINQYDISSIPLYTSGSGVAPSIIAHITLNNKNADGGDVWIDNYIVTQNEP